MWETGRSRTARRNCGSEARAGAARDSATRALVSLCRKSHSIALYSTWKGYYWLFYFWAFSWIYLTLFLFDVSCVWWFSVRLWTWVSVKSLYVLFWCSITTLAVISVPAEQSNTLKHYSTLNGYCDHHTCETALLWQKSLMGCVSLCACVCVLFNFEWSGGADRRALPDPLSMLCEGESSLTDR